MVELVGTDDPRWQRLLETTEPEPYHLPGYAALAAHCECSEAFGLYGDESDAEFLIPLVVRSVPPLGDSQLDGWRDAVSPYGYPGILARGLLPTDLPRLGRRVVDALRTHHILACFIRMNPMRGADDALFSELGAVVDAGTTVFIDLREDDEAIWRGYRREHRRDIRELQSVGYSTRVDEWGDLPAFKALYRQTMQRNAAAEYYRFDDAYFERLREVLGGWLHLVSVVAPDRAVVSAGLFAEGRAGTVYGHLTGSDSSLLTASKLLFDAAWRWAKRRGAHALHLGGGLGRPNDTLLRFKRRFSPHTRTFRTVRVICDGDRYHRACALAGVSGEDLTHFFPAYRRAEPGPGAPLPAGGPREPARAEAKPDGSD